MNMYSTVNERFFFDVETKAMCEVDQLTCNDDPISLAVGMWDDEVPIVFSNDSVCLEWLRNERKEARQTDPPRYTSLEMLIEHLDRAKIIVAYNHKFDMGTLRPYCVTGEPYEQRRARWEEKSIDPFDIIHEMSGQMAGLGDVAKLNLDHAYRKLGKSAGAPIMWKKRDVEQLQRYCTADVVSTKRIYEITTLIIIPEKCRNRVYALSELDVRRRIVELEYKILGAPSTSQQELTQQSCAVQHCRSPSRLPQRTFEIADTIEKLLYEISIADD